MAPFFMTSTQQYAKRRMDFICQVIDNSPAGNGPDAGFDFVFFFHQVFFD
jgi:hypothetical protein